MLTTDLFSILVVDDEPNNFDVIEALLNEQNYELHYASNGKNAISGLNTFQPDLILLDVMMPDMDGIEVCKRIKAITRWHAVPIIMVTALSSKSDLADCLNAGADDFISKPISSVELRARVNSMLRIKKQYDNIQSLSSLQANTIHILESAINELRGNLASKMSHELNTPLNGIIGTIDILLNDLESMGIEEIREILGWADESARRLENLTKKFLMYLELETSPIQQKPFKFSHTFFSSQLITSALKPYMQHDHREQDFVFELEDAELRLSQSYLLTIVYELVENALKFSPAGTPIRVSSHVGAMFNLSVQDFGHGMTAEQIASVGAFIQFDRQVQEQQGTGLGLKIVKKIVELAGGSLTIQSIYQQETTVYISLPMVHSF